MTFKNRSARLLARWSLVGPVLVLFVMILHAVGFCYRGPAVMNCHEGAAIVFLIFTIGGALMTFVTPLTALLSAFLEIRIRRRGP